MAQVRNTANRTKDRTGAGGRAARNTYNTRSRTPYMYDNTARNISIQRQLEEAPAHRLSREARNNRERARRMNPGYLLFLMSALLICGIILVNYIQLQSELTALTQSVASLESELNTLKLENDEEYNRIIANIDLEEIKSVAIGELGMTYAREGQIITYSNEGSDYMRKVSEDN
ncbi:MAG: cell division protein FtsL [Lachnospiraceae bacterium]|nr:cell division protein FtsL [Lachnospiraceae bacterium]